jgi:cyclophilin family peptidyl-prolyl cis-trans isomerase/HEAT repeat protein
MAAEMHMNIRLRTKFLLPLLTCVLAFHGLAQSQTRQLPQSTLLRIVKAEDQRRWDGDLRYLLTSPSSAVRTRAALAAGRIGNEGALAELSNILRQDKDPVVRAMAAFAIGEIESPGGVNSLLTALESSTETDEVKARALEGLGKIAAALPPAQQARSKQIGAEVLGALKSEMEQSTPSRQILLLGITAVLRSRPAEAGPTLALLLTNKDARIRADAANALARLRLKDGNTQLLELLSSDPDPVVRSNAARVLGATEEKSAFDKLLVSATDKDSRVRVSAIRALASLKDSRAAEVLLKRGEANTDLKREGVPSELNEVLEIVTALGRLLAGTGNEAALDWLNKGEVELNHSAPELELALVRISPDKYLASLGSDPTTAKHNLQELLILHWRAGSSVAQALREISALPPTVKNKAELMQSAESLLKAMLDYKSSGVKVNSLLPLHSEYGVPDVLRAYAAFKPKDLFEVVSSHLKENDVIIRATAAELLGEFPPSPEITDMLETALFRALKDDLNDAALSILDSLAKQKSETANSVIKRTALTTDDYLLRQRAINLLKENGAGDYSSQTRLVRTKNTDSDYQRALSRIGKRVRAVVTTTKGSFTMELLPNEAPLTVDNFVQLARHGYFKGIVFHRVVPNFVIQAGDPRGDGNGGPGYTIRCEINEVPYDRAAVGMALSGKDTGGSQWFVTHAPQPHLDGGYTVFGKVVSGMDVVDSIVRGDVIQSIVIR